MEKTQKLKNTVVILSILCVALLAAVIFLLFPAGEPARDLEAAEPLPTEEAAQKLRLEVVVGEGQCAAESGQFPVFHPELEQVTIVLGEERMPLETALDTGAVTVPELWAWAMEDKANRFCRETLETRIGLTEFAYHYEGFDLRVIHDVLEAPDGEDHLICRMEVMPPHKNSSMGRLAFEDENGQLLDREDWGLTMEPQKATPQGLSFQVTQTGGQQLGQLRVERYLLSAQEGKTLAVIPHEENLKMEGQTTLSLDWTGFCGELAPGTYSLHILVEDEYDHAILSPMIRNFYDEQGYWFWFTIPEA